MNFEKKLNERSAQEIWQEYCGFLDLSLDEYMEIQYRLLSEQIDLLSKCGLGQRIFKGQVPKNVDEFRQMVPLTTYDDYADTSSKKDCSSTQTAILFLCLTAIARRPPPSPACTNAHFSAAALLHSHTPFRPQNPGLHSSFTPHTGHQPPAVLRTAPPARSAFSTQITASV